MRMILSAAAFACRRLPGRATALLGAAASP